MGLYFSKGFFGWLIFGDWGLQLPTQGFRAFLISDYRTSPLPDIRKTRNSADEIGGVIGLYI